MKTLIKIEKDNYSNLAYEQKIEDINLIVNEIDVFCIIKNNDFENIVNNQRRYSTHKEGYNECISISAVGYSQSEWQDYVLYYNIDKEDKKQVAYLASLVQHLERSFTHNNNYIASKINYVTIEGKTFETAAEDYSGFCIPWCEFPSEDEVLNSYLEIYGEDYDKAEININ